MESRNNQKLKIMYLLKILNEETDETHNLTMAEIISKLQTYGIRAERKSIYDDIESLRIYGIDIIGEGSNKFYGYHIGSRSFELAELKLLVDSVQAAKFITAKKSSALIKKIESLTSKSEAVQLHRQVYVAERVKTMNEDILYNIDILHSAIAAKQKITFQYFNWNVKKEQVLKKDGNLYNVSPWALTWDDENYYLIAYDSEEQIIKHFRVDKMRVISMIPEQRQGKAEFDNFDMALYAKKMFGMFNGEEQTVKIECENRLAGVMIDRFGKEVMMIPKDEGHFTVSVRVAVSNQFLAWVIALGQGVRIIGPENVTERVRTEVRRLTEEYLPEAELALRKGRNV